MANVVANNYNYKKEKKNGCYNCFSITFIIDILLNILFKLDSIRQHFLL